MDEGREGERNWVPWYTGVVKGDARPVAAGRKDEQKARRKRADNRVKKLFSATEEITQDEKQGGGGISGKQAWKHSE